MVLNVVYVVASIFIIGLGVWYISTVQKINGLDIETRDAGGDIDMSLWDMNHNLSLLIKKLKEWGIEAELPEDKSGALSVGMGPVMQQLVMKNAEERMQVVRGLIEADERSKTDEEVIRCVTKYDNARQELLRASIDYNNKVGRFNSFISNFPASFVADRKHKNAKSIFIYQYQSEDKK